MTIRKIVLPILAALIALPSFAQERLKYHNPTGKEFPILAWFSVLGDENLTPERYKELRDAGFNISFSHFTNTESLEKGLKACRGTGVKIMVTCAELEKNTAETVNRYKGDKSICANSATKFMQPTKTT